MPSVRALLLTDVVDSTQLAQALGDAAMADLWAAHDRLARTLLPLHNGREIDKTDGMLLLFDHAADALAYARAYHAALAGLDPPLKARAGLHVGPVILRHNAPDDVARGAKPLEVDGLAKPMAARVMALAAGGQTLLSADALRELPPQDPAPLQRQSYGHWRMKGVAEPIELFEIGQPPFATPPDGDKGHRVARIGERWLPVREVPGNLPQQATSFLGRHHELDEIKTLLAGAPLVTLLGMGGLGKTRLSLQVAAELRAEHPDGTWFLDLSPLRDPARVVEVAARVLQVQEEAGRSLLQTLCTALAQRRLLLVLDNCEHLVGAAAELAHSLLRAAPGVRLMASSREALRVPGEAIYPVRPLPLPDPEADADPATLARSTAVQLFVARAQATRPAFVLDSAQAPHVAELVARLEGIPLALELAAARVASLAVRDINARLKDRYKLLTGGSRVLQERQQTLRALVDWSYDLLNPSEQTLLQRLGVFVGGFDLAAAEAVCGHDPLDPLDVLDLLTSLVDKSLLLFDEGSTGRGRYRMLETLRDYAVEKAQAAGQLQATQARHVEHFFNVARQLRDGLRGAEQAEWVACGEAELDNLRAAMSNARTAPVDPLLAAKLPVALQSFWTMRGRLGEGRQWLRVAVDLPAVQASDLARAHTLYVAAVLADAQGDALRAQQLLETCLALRRAMNDQAGMSEALSTLGRARLATGLSDAALRAQQEALALFRQIGNHVGETIAQEDLGHIRAFEGDWPAAREHALAAWNLARQLHRTNVEGECEGLLAQAAAAGGDTAAAAQHLQRWLQRAREAGDRAGEARALAALGRAALQSGDTESARLQLGQSLRSLARAEMRADLCACLEGHAELATAFGDEAMAARLLAAARQARERLGLVLPAHGQRRVDTLRQALRQAMGDGPFDQATEEGAGWPLTQAIDAALALAPVSA